MLQVLNTVEIDKVSELEWYLTIESYHRMHHVVICYDNAPFAQKRMTLDDFREFYDRLKTPIVSKENHRIGFFAPFKECINILPGCEIQFPLGYAVQGNYRWIQPDPDKLEISSCRIGGECNGIGEVLNIKNISQEIVHLDIQTNDPFCFLEEIPKETPTSLNPTSQAEYENRVQIFLAQVFAETNTCLCAKCSRAQNGESCVHSQRTNETR